MPLFVHGQEVVSIRNLAATAGTESRLLRAHRRHSLSQTWREEEKHHYITGPMVKLWKKIKIKACRKGEKLARGVVMISK